jgi:hypothetical protein
MATKRKQKKSSKGPFLGLLLVGIIGLGSLAAYVKYGGASKVPDEIRVASHKDKPVKGGTIEEVKVDLITPSRNGEDLKLGKHESDVPKGEDPKVFALNHFLRESKIVPDDAKALHVQVKDGVALVDVTPSFNQTYGSLDEEALLKGMAATLAQFKDIDKMQFFVEGKVVESLGNVDLTEPLPVRTKPASEANSN